MEPRLELAVEDKDAEAGGAAAKPEPKPKRKLKPVRTAISVEIRDGVLCVFMIENDHIVLAVGRDFSDVSPVDGIIAGSRKQKLGVAVDVLPVE